MQVATDIRWTVGTSSVRSASTVSPLVGRSINPPRNTRRPRLSRDGAQSMERSAADDQGVTVAADFLPTARNCSL